MKIADITHGLAEMIKFLKRWKSLFCQTPSQLLKPKKEQKMFCLAKLLATRMGISN